MFPSSHLLVSHYPVYFELLFDYISFIRPPKVCNLVLIYHYNTDTINVENSVNLYNIGIPSVFYHSYLKSPRRVVKVRGHIL